MNISIENSVLIVVDVQGKLARLVYESDRMIRQLQTLIRGITTLGMPILVTEQYPKGLGKTIDELALLLADAPCLEKDAFSCCGEESFLRRLEGLGRSHAILCGIEAHVCVYQTARDLLGRGFGVSLVTDAVSSRLRENRDLAIGKIQSLGAALTGVEMILFELLGRSGTDAFRTISKLVR